VVLCTGFFMILLDTTIVNIAVPSIIDALQAPLDQILWVLNAYVLVYAVLLITAGRLGDIYGQRNMFAAGMVIFVLASAACGQARDINQLIAARVAQGLGGALLAPQTLAIITSIFPPKGRGVAFGVWGAIAGIAAITGPTLGGLIVTNWSWRWIFYVNLPIGAVALALTFLIVPDVRPGRGHRLDIPGVAMATAGLFGIVFGLVEGQRFNWGVITGWLTIPEVIGFGVLLLFAFIIWERYQDEPLIPLSLFSDRNYAVMNWVGSNVSFTILGTLIPITIFFQSVLGMSALAAGLALAPASVVSMFLAPLAGRMADRVGGKYILMLGLVFFAAGTGLAALVASPTSTWSTFVLPFILLGIGQGCVWAPMAAVAMQNISPQIAGAASGVLNTTRQIGMVIGSAVTGAVLQNRLESALYEQALADSTQLPPDMRQRFIDGVAGAARSGLEVGRTEGSGSIPLPPGIPPQSVDQLRQLFHDVFASAFTSAMQPTLLVSAIVLLVAAASCAAISHASSRGEPANVGESKSILGE